MTTPGAELRRLRSLVADLDAVVWEADAASGRFTFVSQRAWDMLGYPPVFWIQEPGFWADHIHPEDRERAVQAFLDAISDARPHDLEYRFLHRDGHVVWLRDIGHTLTDARGRPTVVRGLLVDVTRQKLAEERRAEIERRYRMLVEQLPGIVYLESVEEDQPGHILYVGPQIEEILGVRPEEWLTDPTGWVRRVHPEDLPRLLDAEQEALHAGERFRADYRAIATDGREVWIHDEAVLVRDQDGRPLLWQGVMFDVTEQRRVGERAALSEARYRNLVENIPAIIYTEAVREAEGGVTYVSPQVQRLGYSPEEWLGPTDRWLAFVHPEDRARVRELNLRCDETLEPFSAEYRVLARDGSVVWVRDEAVCMRDADGVPQYWQGVMTDVTAHKRAEELERALGVEREVTARLRELDRMKNTFLQAVSHDLRTPLAAILGLAVTLEREDVLLHPEEAREMAARIAANARRLDRMVNDLLDLDRLSRGIVEPNLAPTDVGGLVSNLVAGSELTAGREVHVEAPPVWAEVDAAKVERIVENLLANAVRHTPAGTRIWVRVEPGEADLTLVVEDEGLGVPPEERERIFEPFRQGAAAPEHSPGVGVGLALVARFAELHGGRAWVEERPGGGASFRVLLPLRPSAGRT